MTRTRLMLMILLLVCVPQALARQTGAALPTTAAPREARQFDFLLGQWTLEVRPKAQGLAAMIHGTPRLLGTWKAWRAFDGFGIEDEMRIMDGSGNPVSLVHAMRVYDKRAGLWRTSGLDVYRSRFGASSSAWRGGQMQGTGSGVGSDGKAYLTRTRFHAIGPKTFTMQQDRSTDGGKNWDEAMIVIVATRTAATAAR